MKRFHQHHRFVTPKAQTPEAETDEEAIKAIAEKLTEGGLSREPDDEEDDG